MGRSESELRAGRVRHPRNVSGFASLELPAKAGQTYRLRGRRGATSIRFDYVVSKG
jgi:hypothetical protein